MSVNYEKAVNIVPIGRRGTHQCTYEGCKLVSYTITSENLVRGTQRSRFGLRKFKRVINSKTVKM